MHATTWSRARKASSADQKGEDAAFAVPLKLTKLAAERRDFMAALMGAITLE